MLQRVECYSVIYGTLNIEPMSGSELCPALELIENAIDLC